MGDRPDDRQAPEQNREVEAGFTTDVGRPAVDDTVVQNPTDVTTNEGRAEAAPLGSIGRYEIKGNLGEGAFGKVYRAWDSELGREVAIKVLNGGMSKGQEARRFLQEAQTAAKLNHPNICPVFDMGHFAGTQYIVMGLIQGKSLQEFLDSDKTVTPRQAVRTVYTLCSALTEAHQQGIVHRDLKPANIMIAEKRNQVVILDFGLARQLNAKGARLTMSGQVFGTPLYMAPEQVRGEIDEVGPRSDIYSLGVILYRMLAARGPFTGSVAEVFAKILYEEPDPPSTYSSAVTAELDALCLQAIAKEPDERYQSMAEFGHALANFLKGSKKSAARQTERKSDHGSHDKSDHGLDADWLNIGEMAVSPSASNVPASDQPPTTASLAPLHRILHGDPAQPPASTPSRTHCPKCNTSMSVEMKLCVACGYHRGLHQQFDVIAQRDDSDEKKEVPSNWLAKQLSEGESVEGLGLAVACGVPVVGLILAALLFGIMGIWALIPIGVLLLVLLVLMTRFLALPIGPASLFLYFCRWRSWRPLRWPSRERKVLDMRDSLTADADLESLKPDWKLEVLDLENTKITDLGLEHLARLDTLRYLVLRRTQVSGAGVARLKSQLPRTRIWS